MATLMCRLLLIALMLGAAASCSTTPTFRPPLPGPSQRDVELGLGAQLVGGQSSAELPTGGGGMTAWTQLRIAESVELFVTGSASGTAALEGAQLSFGGHLVGGGGGVRFRPPTFLDDLVAVVELGGEYVQQDINAPTRRVSGIARISVAQLAFGDVWVYATPSLGIALPLEKNPILPFFGFFELPVGAVWQIDERWSLVLEGGAWGPLQGGYGAAALLLRL